MMLIMLFKILRRSRVGHPRVTIRYVVTVWRRSSFLTNPAAQYVLYLFKMFNLGSGVWIPYYRRGILKFWSD